MDFSQKIMKYKFFRWFLQFTMLSKWFILKPEVKAYQYLEKPWKTIPKTNLVARKPQIFENWAFFKIIVFWSGVGHLFFKPPHAGIYHVMMCQFRAEIPTKKKCHHPLHFELKLPNFRAGVYVKFLAICMTHTTAKIPCLNLYNKCNKVLLFGATLFPKLRGGPYPLFQTRVKKVGSVYWCRIQIS